MNRNIYKSFNLVEKIKNFSGLLLLIITATLTFNLVEVINTQRQTKNDLAEINNIKYGLFNAEVWVDTIFTIVAKKIDEFEITNENKAEIRKSIEKVIDEAIVLIDDIIRKRNSECDGLFDCGAKLIKQGLTDLLVDINSLREYVPKFTDIAFEQLNQPDAKAQIKELIKEKLYELHRESFMPVDMTRYTDILNKYGCTDRQSCQSLMLLSINFQEKQIISYSIWIFSLVTVLFGILLVKNPRLSQYEVWILVLACVVLLLGGITTPMIEIEAKIAEFSFKLFGEPVSFTEQVMYYQSKSITDVVTLLLATGKFKMVLVGVLVSVFSVTFPVLKLLASLVYFYDINGKRKNAVVRFFALKSGKWSMADVMVVAIFMACIGFDGIITSQLSQLGQVSRHVDILTTGGSQLLAGFYLFLGFCMASLVFSAALENSVDRVEVQIYENP